MPSASATIHIILADHILRKVAVRIDQREIARTQKAHRIALAIGGQAVRIDQREIARQHTSKTESDSLHFARNLALVDEARAS